MTLLDHSTLPAVETARLPMSYEQARQALAECVRMDECKEWSDRAEALASYARQSQDDELRRMCDRIQARAIRRCGELLQEIPRGTGANQGERDGTVPLDPTRKSAADAAGLSERQRKTALRVANVSDEEFEDLVESDDPPTVTNTHAFDPWGPAITFAMEAVWQDAEMRCLVCDEPLGRCAAYAAVVLPHDDLAHVPCQAGGVCAGCGAAKSREHIFDLVKGQAMLSLGAMQGNA